MKRLFCLLTAAAFLSALASGSPVFTSTPANGALFGAPGSTVGWGFTIADSAEFVLLSQTGFCVTAVQVSDLPCTAQIQAVGTYTDFSFNAPVVGPPSDSSPVARNFDSIGHNGFGEFQISGGAAVGTILSGEIAIVYDRFTSDPNTDPNAVQVGGDNFTSLPASVNVTAITAAPEPGMTLPLGLSLAGLVWLGRRRFVCGEWIFHLLLRL
jgi:hypothetical protein